MEINILEESKEEIKVEVDNVTIVELLRVYLNQDANVSFAAWKRDHPTENPTILVKTKSGDPKKAVEKAISAASKDLDSFEKDFDKLK